MVDIQLNEIFGDLGRGIARTVTNNLPLLYVLGFRYCFLLKVFSFVVIRMTPFSPALP